MTQRIQGLIKKEEDKIPAKENFITKLIHFAAYLKDYLIAGVPAIFLLLAGKLMGYKNGEMLIWLKKKTTKDISNLSNKCLSTG